MIAGMDTMRAPRAEPPTPFPATLTLKAWDDLEDEERNPRLKPAGDLAEVLTDFEEAVAERDGEKEVAAAIVGMESKKSRRSGVCRNGERRRAADHPGGI